ncbi:MAG: polyphosphate polymerase domain-containing protein [Erysipelotrichaceae bacterium]|nr:polyphosphate polymerase domain-containing protein [Erysipelotrichaceae bacterium]
METFRRFEKKYLLDERQYRRLMVLLKDRILPDKFYETDIRSIYYDTDDHELIRRSIEKPEYKEKLRIRSYKEVTDDETVFVELKKKFDGIVYKRRTKALSVQLLDDLYKCQFKDPQVGKEILYASDHYGGLRPSIFIGCKRTSFTGKEDEDLRITFDKEICYRMEDLSLRKTEKDKLLTDKTVMELKIKDAMPLWLSEILDEVKAYPRGFSKVGNAFLKELQGV